MKRLLIITLTLLMLVGIMGFAMAGCDTIEDPVHDPMDAPIDDPLEDDDDEDDFGFDLDEEGF